jgi:spermidine/putrescine transport system ATP-binding protein
MSGGQQQRVALARALVNRPRALLLDEPLGALDLRLRKQLQLELSQIQRDVGITFIHVTHDQEEAMTMADTIAVMRDGRIDQLGSATDLYDHPRTAFVANFLGNSNLINADVVSNSGAFAEVDADGGARLKVPSEPVAAAGSAQIRIGVRPEKMTLDAANGKAQQGESNALLGHIVDAAYIGLATQYVVHTDGGADLQVFVQNSANGTSALEEGDRVVVGWDPEHTFVVEREEPNAG